MSAKSVDSKGRFRSETIAFRVSPAEKKAIHGKAKLCGYQNMQYFLLDSLLHQQIKAEESINVNKVSSTVICHPRGIEAN